MLVASKVGVSSFALACMLVLRETLYASGSESTVQLTRHSPLLLAIHLRLSASQQSYE